MEILRSLTSCRRMILTLLALNIYSQISAQESGFKDKLSTNLIIQYRTAFEFESSEFQKNELILKPNVTFDLSKKIRLYSSGRFYSELNDNLEPGKPDQSAISTFSRRGFIGDRVEVELRELYFDWYVGKRSTIRFGKQQVVWGETDGLKLLDVVNPQSFREFILDDFEDSRIPLWSVKVELPVTETIDAELLWIPDQTYNYIPSLDAPFFPGAVVPSPPEGVVPAFDPIQKPDQFLKDSEVGIRLSTFMNGWDLTFSYLYHYDDLPGFYLGIQPADPPLLQISQRFNRIHLVGATFNKALGSFVLRGETAINLDRRFSTEEIGQHNGVRQSDQVMNTIGLDWISGEWVASFQLFNDYLFQEIDPFNRDDHEVNWTFLLSRELMNDNLKVEMLTIQNLNQKDLLLRPKASYFLRSNVELAIGGDLFFGDSNGLFGQFEDRNRLSIGIEWGL